MTPLFWTGIAISGLFFLAYTVIPLWMTFKYPHRRPNFADARAYLRGKAMLERGEAVVAGAQYRPAGVRPADRENARQAA
jgi:hypothetical protein